MRCVAARCTSAVDSEDRAFDRPATPPMQ